MNSKNIELMGKVREIIADNPERHDQNIYHGNAFERSPTFDYFYHIVPAEQAREWALRPIPEQPENQDLICGTTACVAGWAAILAAPAGSQITGRNLQEPYGPQVHIEDYARRHLGITHVQAAWLFHSRRSRDEVLRGIDYLLSHPDATSGGGLTELED